MAHIDEVLPIVVDPNHERFGQIGEMTFSGARGDGTSLIKFEDGEEEALNDGWVTGTPQFIAPLKERRAGVESLQAALPDMQHQLAELVEKVVDPTKRPPTPETVAAVTGFVALINGVLFESSGSGQDE